MSTAGLWGPDLGFYDFGPRVQSSLLFLKHADPSFSHGHVGSRV